MKKLLLTTTCLSLFSFVFGAEYSDIKTKETVNSDKGKIVAIDSRKLLQESKEGQKLASSIQKEVEAFQKEVAAKQKELTDFQASVEKQAKVLSKEALMEKGEKLNQMKKDAERTLGDKEETLKIKIQKEQGELIEKQLTIANDIFEKEGWAMMVDKHTPGVFCVSNAIDITDKVLKEVDKKFDTTSNKAEKKA